MSEKLITAIKQLYDGKISDEEALEAQRNLLGFFETLAEIDARLTREKETAKKDQDLNQTKPRS